MPLFIDNSTWEGQRIAFKGRSENESSKQGILASNRSEDDKANSFRQAGGKERTLAQWQAPAQQVYVVWAPSYWDLCLLEEGQQAQTMRLKFSVRTSRHASSVCYSRLLLANKKLYMEQSWPREQGREMGNQYSTQPESFNFQVPLVFLLQFLIWFLVVKSTLEEQKEAVLTGVGKSD